MPLMTHLFCNYYIAHVEVHNISAVVVCSVISGFSTYYSNTVAEEGGIPPRAVEHEIEIVVALRIAPEAAPEVAVAAPVAVVAATVPASEAMYQQLEHQKQYK
jgi:hypothetical protein